MAINTSNSAKGANGGTMPLQGSNDGSSPWARRSPGNEWQGGRKAAGPDVGLKTGPTPDGFPSKTPRPGGRR